MRSKLPLFLLLLVAALALPSLAHAAGAGADEVQDNFFKFHFDEFGRKFPWRFGLNLASVIILIAGIYYPAYRKKDYFFTFFMFNLIIFFVTLLLNKVELSTGAAFGLFAVFSLLRYRTEDIDAKDMTYLFTVIAIGLVTAVNKGNLLEMVLVNGVIILSAYLLDGQLLLRTEVVKNIQYDDISKIKPDQEAELIKDLRQRTGLDIHHVEVGRVDYLRDSANLKIYYYDSRKKRI